ncbi:MAG: hypothetical protein NT013_05060 [Planctomycetia bacterium]|nr:hypothetical protein [Planctomycetia bacterium]
MHKLPRIVVIGILTVALFVAQIYRMSLIAADDPAGDTGTAERQALLKEMRSAAAAAIKVTEKAGEQLRPAKLVEEPIFRYSDEQRLIRDATMWIWTIEGRPVSVMKLERYSFPDPKRHWLFNVGSAPPNLFTVTWPFDREFESKKPGLAFQPLKDGAELAVTKAARLIQLKQLSRRFTSTMTGGSADDAKTEMRLLPTPLFRYASPADHIADGALFGLSATGTNPDAMVAIQWRGDGKEARWEFGVTGMTNGGLQVRLDDKPVWSQPYLVSRGQVFETWTYFFSERSE